MYPGEQLLLLTITDCLQQIPRDALECDQERAKEDEAGHVLKYSIRPWHSG